MNWDIFCTVVDNYGDVGVCWRLGQALVARGEQVRLWVDDVEVLRWMQPVDLAASPHFSLQICAWAAEEPGKPAAPNPELDHAVPGDVVIEAFGCALPSEFVHRMASLEPAPQWINLEYLTAEPYARRCHDLQSPVLVGPGQGLSKRFYYPGFCADTGGLLREPSALPAVDPAALPALRTQWLDGTGTLPDAETQQAAAAARWVSLFCYEPAALGQLVLQLVQSPSPTHLWVTAGRTRASVQPVLDEIGYSGKYGNDCLLSISYLPFLSQTEFDRLLNLCDLNFVRGEDSVVQALWAGKPLVWNIYPQHDGAHFPKLHAFLDAIEASPELRQWHQAWNAESPAALPSLEPLWRDQSILLASRKLAQQQDLCSRLLALCQSRHRPRAV